MKKNKMELDAPKEGHAGHFFVCSAAEWMTGRDPERLVRAMRRAGFVFSLWYVPAPETEEYKIAYYAPQVEGAVIVATYGMDHADKAAAELGRKMI